MYPKAFQKRIGFPSSSIGAGEWRDGTRSRPPRPTATVRLGGRPREERRVLSLQEVSDRMEIQDVMAKYSAAVDGHRWELFDEVFVPDAELDYTDVADFKVNDVQTFTDWLAGA